MTEPIPVRAVERQRITRPHEVIEIERVVEYAARVDDSARAALPSGEARGYDPERDSPLASTGMHLDGWTAARRALPPAAPTSAPPWWRRWWR